MSHINVKMLWMHYKQQKHLYNCTLKAVEKLYKSKGPYMLKLKGLIVILDSFANVFRETYFTFQLEESRWQGCGETSSAWSCSCPPAVNCPPTPHLVWILKFSKFDIDIHNIWRRCWVESVELFGFSTWNEAFNKTLWINIDACWYYVLKCVRPQVFSTRKRHSPSIGVHLCQNWITLLNKTIKN